MPGARRLACIAIGLTLFGCGDQRAGRDPAEPVPPGQLTYQRFCISCHAGGIGGAPRAGDAQAWAPRLAQGDDVLLRHTIDGMRSSGMPPRGLCSTCTDQELREAIGYMSTTR